MRTRAKAFCTAGLFLMTCGVASADPAIGQVDTFQDGTSDNWEFGHGTPQVVLTGGPGGAGDAFLEMSGAGGAGAGSKPTVFNDSQWTGDYSAAGIGAIALDLKDLSTAPLDIRIAIKTGNGITPGWASTTGFALPADGAWHHATFPLDSADLTPVNSPPPLSTILTDVGELRILESAAPALDGDSIAASVGIDNITAVPEPATAMIAAGAMGGVLARRRKR